MAKCCLGPKKVRKIEAITGWKVRSAYVRGGWDHFWAEVWFEGVSSVPFAASGSAPYPFVNYKTGEIDWGAYDKKVLEEKGTRVQ
jgi:hypothetical protein